jgi:hypothetical protein
MMRERVVEEEEEEEGEEKRYCLELLVVMPVILPTRKIKWLSILILPEE